MNYNEDQYLPLSGLQHFAFCRRQWALIHIEKLWQENLRTVEGHLLHERAHDKMVRERRGGVITVRGVRVSSAVLGVSGQCDVLEFHSDLKGIPLAGQEGTWIPYPVEYKRGIPKENPSDRLQLCGQAMCIEEMMCCSISEGALYYGEIRRREVVLFTEELRQKVKKMLIEMHQIYDRGYTPKGKRTKSCNACSLKELCLPMLFKTQSVTEYLTDAMEESE